MDLKNQTQKREIKFRGKGLNGWVKGLLTHDKKKDNNYEWFISSKAGKPYAYVVYPESIGQFTNVLDKNSVEIYEKDIVCYPENEFVGRVYFDVQTASYRVVGGGNDMPLITGVEVIGNTYDNIDLLDVKQQGCDDIISV